MSPSCHQHATRASRPMGPAFSRHGGDFCAPAGSLAASDDDAPMQKEIRVIAKLADDARSRAASLASSRFSDRHAQSKAKPPPVASFIADHDGLTRRRRPPPDADAAASGLLRRASASAPPGYLSEIAAAGLPPRRRESCGPRQLTRYAAQVASRARS